MEVDLGDGNNVLKLANTESAFIVAGQGNDLIDASGQSMHLSTGDGNDTIVLGSQSGAYFANSGDEDRAILKDFSERDRLYLYGSASDYTLTTNQLFYQSDLIAIFENGVNFTLNGDQVSFIDENNGNDLPRADSLIPTVDEMLNRVETYHVNGGEQPIYRISGGDDAAAFTINSITGDLILNSDANGNSWDDVDGDGQYDVIVEAALPNSSAETKRDQQRLTITVPPNTTDSNPVVNSTDITSTDITSTDITSTDITSTTVASTSTRDAPPSNSVTHTAPPSNPVTRNAPPPNPVITRNKMMGTIGNDRLKGTSQADTIEGKQGRDKLDGKRGDDHLLGEGGHDMLKGGLGHDILNGTNSTLQGIQEKDSLWGGQGSDLFVLGDVNGVFYAGHQVIRVVTR